MAIFFLQINSLSRSTGRRAVAAAAYRAGERLRDERSGELHNHSRRRDVLHTEIFVPAQFAQQALPWARDRERLWNSAEHAEPRYNARVAREVQVNLPAELSAPGRVSLARAFAAELAERYRVAVDLAVHAPRAGSDPRNFHAHLLLTTREVTPQGLGARAGLDLTARERRQRELPDHGREYRHVRERWATLANLALQAENLKVRIDHRSLAAQGIDREPKPRIPLLHLKLEQRGDESAYAAKLRTAYGERVARRAERAAQPATHDLEEVRRRARVAWLDMRSQERAAAGKEAAAARAREDDELTR